MNKNENNPIITIREVAAEAGVSITTVTHALSGKRPVNDETKKKVFDAVDKLNYVPSYNASHLRKKFSNIIGCFSADLTQDFSSRILKGIEEGLAGSGYSLMIASGVEFGGDYAKACRFFRKYDVDGVIVCHHLLTGPDCLPAFGKADFPVVFVNYEYEGRSCFVPDNEYAGRLAARHLLDLGVVNPAYLGGPSERLSVKDRLSGFRTELHSSGKFSLLESQVLYGDYTFDSGLEMAEELFLQNPSVDGVFCANDYIAAGCLRCLRRKKIDVPAQVKVIGCDNRDFSSFLDIPLTTITLPLEEMGIKAVKKLRAHIENGDNDFRTERLKPGLVIRESSCLSKS